MANFRGLLVITYFLAALQLFVMQPVYCDWKNDFTEWKNSRTLNPKGISTLSSTGNVIIVDAKGNGQFTTVQGAIKSIPANNNNPVTIKVNPGTYKEKIEIPLGMSHITLTGSGSDTTVITWNDDARSSGGTFLTATVNVLASDFTARDITIQNSYGQGDLSGNNQAVALKVSGDRCAFYNCRILGFQDTLLDHIGRHYFKNCYIEGAVDFIFGNGKSIYQSCELHAIPVYYGSFTAQNRGSPSEDTGFVFLNCRLTGKGPNYLGKPWGDYSTVVFANTYMEDIIYPVGWGDWDTDFYKQKSVTYGEFQNSGPGAVRKQRAAWSQKLTTRSQFSKYLTLDYINGSTWIKQ
eukprot:PITA_01067